MKFLYFWAVVSWIMSGAPLFAQRTDSLFRIQAEEILDKNPQNKEQEASIASKRKQALAKAPAIVTVITAQDISQSGCKDIADVLRLVPGFEFGVDVQSLFGLGSRGLWAHEGKALVLINNIAINCFGYGNGNFFGAVPAYMIDRVEIIRGPGSTLYGGFAEVAVINIMTKKGTQLRGVELTAVGGAFSPTEWTRGGNLSAGFAQGDWELSFHVGTNKTPNSIRPYVDYLGTTTPSGNESSWRKWAHVVAEGNYKNFHFSYNRIQQDFLAEDVLGFIRRDSALKTYTNQLNFNLENLRMHCEMHPYKDWTLKPSLELSRGLPISTAVSPISRGGILINPADLWQNASIDARRYQAELEVNYAPSEKDELVGGIGGQIHTLYCISTHGDYGLLLSENPADTAANVTRGSAYAFAQYTRQGNIWGITAGGRAEYTPFGTAVVPRAGITWVKKNWNAKFLYGRAFRVPLLYQAYSRQYSAAVLSPEITSTFDLEVGYKFAPASYARLNVFHTTIDKPITYIGASNSYQNYGQAQSTGLELEVRRQGNHSQYFANFSYARPLKQHTTPDFMNSADNAFLALPTLKANAGGSLTYKKMTVGSTLTWLGKRYAQTQNSALNSTATTLIRETTPYPAVWLWNANILLKGIFSPNLSLRLNAYNVLNAPYLLLQPYYGGHAPMPVGDRQVDMAVIVKF